MLGITFFQASMNVASAAWAAGRSVKKDRALAAKMGRAKSPDARRNILGGDGRSALARSETDRKSISSLHFLVAV